MIKQLNFIVALLIVLGITLIPSFSISSKLPAFQLIDFLLPFIAVLVFAQRSKIVIEKLYKYFLIFGLYILFTMFWNGRLDQMRDYFEIYKIAKFALVIIFFSVIDVSKLYNRILYPVFGGLVIFNMLHYFNLFNFNYVLEHFYNGGIHIQTFGLNSIGGTATRRMIGTIGNPNNNAILFLIFSILFLPRQKQDIFRLTVFFFAVSMFFLCQSRTGFVALILLLLAYVFLAITKNKLKLFNKFALYNLGIIVLSFFISYLFSVNAVAANPYISDIVLANGQLVGNGMTPSYLNSLFSSSVYQSNSVQGRLIVWEHLWQMIKLKPLFGHAPYKEYFYDNDLYAESEYVMMTWRYGFIGLAAYVLFYLSLILQSVKKIDTKYGLTLLFVILVTMTASLTNNPLMNKDLFILVGIILGLYYNKSNSILNG